MFSKLFKTNSENETEEVDLDENKIPNHIAIIMDGNGRWAQKRRLPRVAGHKQGMENVKEITKAEEIRKEYFNNKNFLTRLFLN